ncbi:MULTISPECIES: hypothetical protein [Streptosporangium]|uniref:Uncharacterized protein n=1 Tax=Streptosporangium brasiliense TaxID=47480 RepID=A0ABT9RHV1_9ACTN|nr:hypothetical protein [Streptosporangium brasiliense]MDP9868871.1 hypothetical protein [Streptosporangium brasiliense]
MSESFAAAVRDRVRRADAALAAARLSGDIEEVMLAEAEWEEARHTARRHGVPVGSAEPGEGSVA